jgi:Kdo2-lipid IVA lauroyltransferase/acyltransferase
MKPWGRSRRPSEVVGRLMKFLKGLRLRLEFAALWLAIILARAMPVQAASWLSGNIWRLVAPRLGRQNRALANLKLAYPEKSLGERKAIAAAMWENLGRTFAESLHIQALTKSDRIVFEPPERFDEAASGAKPFIVCGLHLGNWEILAHGGQRLGVSLIGVYQRMSNPHVEALMRSMREPLYTAGLTPKTPMAARVLLRAIKNGASPCFLADLRDDNGPLVPFFGRLARSTVFPALLARTTGIPLYAGAAFRRPGSRFSIRIAPISMPRTNNSAADALVATQALQRQYEAFIREAPEQWMWAHRKWD